MVRKMAKNKMPFGLWEFSVYSLLIHADAIYCTVGDHNETLEVFYCAGFKPGGVAKRLNERYCSGFLERKAAMARAAEDEEDENGDEMFCCKCGFRIDEEPLWPGDGHAYHRQCCPQMH
jgi:hypothetical protein